MPARLQYSNLRPDVGVVIFCEIDGAASVKLDARGDVVRQRSRLRLRIHREMVFDILRIQFEHVKLFHEGDHLPAAEVAKCVAGQT